MVHPDGVKVNEGIGPEIDTRRVMVEGEERHQQVVQVANQLSLFPLPTAQVTTLTPQKDALTDAQLRAAPVGVDTGQSQPLTNAQLRQSAVPVTGPATDAQLRASPLPVDIGENINLEIADLTVEFNSIVSTLNTTDVPLDANEVFVGEWEEVLHYAAITAVILTDAPSAQQGAMAQFSADGQTIISVGQASIVAGHGAYFSIPPQARFFRIYYVNGPQAQTELSAEVTYRFNPPTQTQQPLAAMPTDATIGSIGKSVLAGRVQTPQGGIYLPVSVSSAGALTVDQQPRVPAVPLTAVAKIGVPGVTQLIAPPGAGKRLVVHYVYFTPKDEPPLVTVRFATSQAPLFSGFAAGKSWRWTGGEDEGVEAVLDQAGDVAFTILYEEVAA